MLYTHYLLKHNYYCYGFRFGPLRHQWCMRFEAKNHQIKRLVGLNFKNVPKTVATRHQLNMCLNLLAPPGVATSFLYEGDIVGRGMCCVWALANRSIANYRWLVGRSGTVKPLM